MALLYPAVNNNKEDEYELPLFEIRNNGIYPTTSNNIDSYGLSLFNIR